MSRRLLVAGVALVLLVAAGGIALVVMARADAAPDGPPSIRGAITSMSALGGPGVIFVEERPQDPPGLGKASVAVNGATRIYRGRFSASTKGSPGDLRNGQLVEIWFSGPVLTTYPVQGTAGVILIP